MLSVLSGLAITGAGLAGFWFAKPRNGKVQWYVEAPILEWLIPITLIGILAIGFGLVLSGIGG